MTRTLKDCLNEVGIKNRKFVPILKNHSGIIYYKVHGLTPSRKDKVITMSVQEFYDPLTLPKIAFPPNQDTPTKQTTYKDIYPHLWDNEYEENKPTQSPLKIHDPHLSEPYTRAYNLDIDNAD